MSRKTTTFTIGQDEFEVTQLEALEGYWFYNELIGAIGPVFAEKMRTLAGKEKLDLIEVGLLAVEFKRQLPMDLTKRLLAAFMRTSRVKTPSLPELVKLDTAIFNEIFAGRMNAIDQWMFACAKHNFLGFLSESDSSDSSSLTETLSESTSLTG